MHRSISRTVKLRSFPLMTFSGKQMLYNGTQRKQETGVLNVLNLMKVNRGAMFFNNTVIHKYSG